MSVVHVKYITK